MVQCSCRNEISSFKAAPPPQQQKDLRRQEVFALYHNEIVEEEDFSLVRRLLLGLVDVGHLEEPTAAHQAPVRDREHLRTRGQRFWFDWLTGSSWASSAPC